MLHSLNKWKLFISSLLGRHRVINPPRVWQDTVAETMADSDWWTSCTGITSLYTGKPHTEQKASCEAKLKPTSFPSVGLI